MAFRVKEAGLDSGASGDDGVSDMASSSYDETSILLIQSQEGISLACQLDRMDGGGRVLCSGHISMNGRDADSFCLNETDCPMGV